MVNSDRSSPASQDSACMAVFASGIAGELLRGDGRLGECGAELHPAAALGFAMIAALYVQDDGCYSGVDGVDMWPESRDARSYQGPHRVVAHPPCQRWGNFAAINYKRWGGEHNRPGNDGGCFAAAFAAVNKWGGVLEHPAFSRAFPAHGIDKPPRHGWARSGQGWVCEVWQSPYGHRARKATWLYYVGPKPFGLDWSRPKGTHQIGWQDQRGKAGNKPTLSKKEANATPPAFRDMLLRLAGVAP